MLGNIIVRKKKKQKYNNKTTPGLPTAVRVFCFLTTVLCFLTIILRLSVPKCGVFSVFVQKLLVCSRLDKLCFVKYGDTVTEYTA